MTLNNLSHNDGAYALCIEYGEYHRALHVAIRGLRRARNEKLNIRVWESRVWGCFTRRNG